MRKVASAMAGQEESDRPTAPPPLVLASSDEAVHPQLVDTSASVTGVNAPEPSRSPTKTEQFITELL